MRADLWLPRGGVSNAVTRLVSARFNCEPGRLPLWNGPPNSTRPMTMPASLKRAETALRKYALTFPGAAEEFPWGERVIKVGGKIFVFLGIFDDCLRVGVKLPTSAEMALTLPFAARTGYGLGRAGWITAKFAPNDEPPGDLLKEWIAQSYRAVVPKKLLKTLEANARLAGAR